MLMVLVLVSILAIVAIPQFVNLGNDARSAVTRDRMNSIKAAIIGDARLVSSGLLNKLGYEANCVGLPSVLGNLIAQPAAGTCASAYNPFTQRGWRGPYLTTTDSSWSSDSWGTALQYSSAARTLTSCGADKVCGTSDDITISF